MLEDPSQQRTGREQKLLHEVVPVDPKVFGREGRTCFENARYVALESREGGEVEARIPPLGSNVRLVQRVKVKDAIRADPSHPAPHGRVGPLVRVVKEVMPNERRDACPLIVREAEARADGV